MDPAAASPDYMPVWLALVAIFGQVVTVLLQWMTKNKVEQVHTEVNSRLTAALAEVKKLTGERANEQQAVAVKEATLAGVGAGAAAAKKEP